MEHFPSYFVDRGLTRHMLSGLTLAACLVFSEGQAWAETATKAAATAVVKTVNASFSSEGGSSDNSISPHAGLQNQYQRSGARSFQDVVDPYTGNLTVKTQALTIPGNGGLDMTVGWTYKMEGLSNSGSSSPAVDSSAAFSTAGYGVWQLEVAPVVVFSFQGISPFSACSANVPNEFSYRQAAILQTAGGNAETLYYVSQGTYETKSHWRLACDAANNTQILRSPNGTSYRLGVKSSHLGTPNNGPSQDVYQTTRVTDRHGNYYDIAYIPVTLQYCFDSKKSGTSTVHLPSRLSASDGRQITFSYDAGVQNCSNQTSWRSPRLQSMAGPDGAVWQFNYHPHVWTTRKINGYGATYFVGGQLAGVTLPDNTSYQFQYSIICPTSNDGNVNVICDFEPLSQVGLPTGGTVSYKYRTVFNLQAEGFSSYPLDGWPSLSSEQDNETRDGILEYAHYVWGHPDVLERRTSDGGVWTYAYERPVSKNVPEGTFDVTTIDGPAGREVYRFYGLGYFTPTAVASTPALHNVCNPTRSLYSNYCGLIKPGAWQVGLPVDITVGDEYIERYVYQPRMLTSASGQELAGRIWIADDKVFVPDLQSKTVVVNGVSFNTSYANYDAYGNPGTVTESGPHGGIRTTTVSYRNDPVKWFLKQVKDESFPGSATTRSFNTNGNLLSVTTDGVTTSYTYDSQGNVASATFPRNLLHSYSNYVHGIPQTETQPEGVQITRTVSDAGAVVKETNGEGHTRSYGFDSMQRLTSITYARGNATAISYSANGKTMTRGSLVESTVYDGFGRPQSISLGGVIRSYGYDALGRKSFESNPGSTAGTSYQYDVLHRPVRITNADGSAETISYAGVDKTIVDERNNSTTYQYRAYGNIKQLFLMGVAAADPSMNIRVMRNARDLVTDIFQGGLTRTYGYNGSYYLTSVTNPESGVTVYGRDEAGNMTSRVVASSGKVTFTYDARNRVSAATYPSGTPSVRYTYSKTDKIKSVSTTVGDRVNEYDANDNLISERVVVDGMTFNTGYTYNGNDQLDSMTYPRSGRVVSYMPDVLGRPTQVSGFVSSIGYWPSGQVSQINYVNGTTSTYSQNDRLWPSSFSTTKGDAIYVDNSYQYDGAGNLTSIRNSVDSSHNRALGYDTVARLTKVDGPWGTGKIAYDGAGNITSQALGAGLLNYSYDSANRLGSISGTRATQFSYDDYGNVIVESGNRYTYDEVPNLRCINCGNPSYKTEYSYDGLNRRLIVNKVGEKSYEIYGSNGNQLIEFIPGQKNKLIEYFHLGGKRIAQTITP